MFLDFETWKEAEENFPEETKRDRPLHFIDYPLHNVPQQLKSNCSLLKAKEENNGLSRPYTIGRASCVLSQLDPRAI